MSAAALPVKLDLDRVVEAVEILQRPFVGTAQYRSEGISRLLGIDVILKIETTNPVGSVMGRAAEWFFINHSHTNRIICASAGDFGIAMAYAGSGHSVDIELFVPVSADPAKVAALRHAGTTVHLDAEDPEEVKEEARRYADVVGGVLLLDGEHVEFAEGLATMAAELEHLPKAPDAVFVPLGEGSLALGTGAWCHARMPRTRVVGVAPEGAPATAQAVRVPSERIVAPLIEALDDTALVSERHMQQAAAVLATHEGLRVSCDGAAALAAAAVAAPSMRGASVVVAVTSRAVG
jgi:threonine dehydratase